MTTTGPASNSLHLRTAGVLFLISGVVTILGFLVRMALLSEFESTDSGFYRLFYFPLLAVAIAEQALLAAGYIVLFFLLPRGRLQWVFLVAALGHVLDGFATFFPLIGAWSHWIAVAGTIASGIYVLARTLLTRIPSVVFFVTVVVGLAPVIYERVAPPTGLLYIVFFVVSTSLFALSGVTMLVASRTRTRSTATV